MLIRERKHSRDCPKHKKTPTLVIMLSFERLSLVLTLVFFLLQPVIGKQCGNVDIRFPFYVRNSSNLNDSSSSCGYDLLCTETNETLLELPHVPINFSVSKIDYKLKQIIIHDDPNHDCLANQLLKLGNAPNISPFHFLPIPYSDYYDHGIDDVSVFHCDSTPSCPVLLLSEESTYGYDGIILSCTKVKDVLSVQWSFSYYYFDRTVIMEWSKPACSTNGNHHNSTLVLIAASGGIGGLMLLLLMVIALVYMYRHYEMKGEDRARIEKFLSDYRAMKPTRFTYADIKRITNGFGESLGEGAHGAVFKGMISREILVAVKVLNDTVGDGKDFINEVVIIGKIHHVNIVRLLGFCADGFHRALVYDFFPNGSLQRFLPSPNKDFTFLGWENLLQIALGIAKGIEYLHLGCDHRILHFDINPHNVLLDDQLVPKITDFGLAKLCPKNQSTVSMTAAKGTLGYIAPEVFSRNFGNVSYKSDIYSFGMLLLEMVGGRKNTNVSNEESFQVLYPEWIHNLVEGNDIQVTIEDEGDFKIAKKLATVGLWCIQWNPIDRPSMKTVVQMLEGDGEQLIAPLTPFDNSSTSRTNVVPARRQNLELEVIHEIEE